MSAGEEVAADRGGEGWARAAWSIVAEPGDAAAGAVVAALGAPAALAWALWAVTATPADALRRLRDLVRAGDHGGAPDGDGARRVGDGARRVGDGARRVGDGVRRVGDGARRVGDGVRSDGDGARRAGDGAWPDGDDARPAGDDPWPDATVRVLARALPRWAPRLADLDPRPALDDLARQRGVLVLPGTPAWPSRLDDLGPAAPLCLWLRGDPDLAGATARSVAVVGARAATSYGERVAGDLGAGLAGRGVTVVSGGAFGVDVAAHRGALAAGGRTVALLAGGVDRPSPAGNLAVLERIVDAGGALVAESPPGTPPSRARFLQRNRVIAALAGATVVVEAAWRSGALSTAARAGELLRPVGAVPGPVTSMASVGCHRLLRDGAAVCVTDAAEVVELLDPPGSAGGTDDAGRPDAAVATGRAGEAGWSRATVDAVRPRGAGATGRTGDAGRPGASDRAGRPGATAHAGRPGASDHAGRPGATAHAGRPGAAGDEGRPGATAHAGRPGASDHARRPGAAADAGRLRADGVPERSVPGVADRADSPAARVLDALDRRRGRAVDEIARRSGLAEQEVVAALGLLELAGEACRAAGRWRRAGAPG